MIDINELRRVHKLGVCILRRHYDGVDATSTIVDEVLKPFYEHLNVIFDYDGEDRNDVDFAEFCLMQDYKFYEPHFLCYTYRFDGDMIIESGSNNISGLGKFVVSMSDPNVINAIQEKLCVYIINFLNYWFGEVRC